MLGGPQRLPMEPEQWQSYQGEIPFLLSQAYSEMKQAGDVNAHGKLLDLLMFTDPPLPYFLAKGRLVRVASPNAPEELRGRDTVAGFPLEMWDVPARDHSLLPAQVRGVGSVVGYFYQVHHDSVNDLEQLEAHLEDASGKTPPPAQNPRRRVVIFVQLPKALSGDTRRFARRRAPAPAQEMAPAESVTVLAEGTNQPAVYEWWYGPSPVQHVVENPPIGRWKSYHPQVCLRLEELFRTSPEFREGAGPADVDGVRYMMQGVSAERPFDYVGKPSRETFSPENKITIEHPCFSDMDRASHNCFVQFQKGNPQRRRPARRRPDASEIARCALMTGSPCSICFSEDGQLTGCNLAHVICKGCLRAGLRAVAGDTTVVEKLLCGCFGRNTRRALLALAEHADVSLQDSLTNPPTDPLERQDFKAEVVQTRRQFDLGEGEIPSNLYNEKIREWYKKVSMSEVAFLYHTCSHPACANKLENWILIEDFERDYQARGLSTWVCRDGHRNSVIPSEEEIDEMNRNLLLHPEYYVSAAQYSNCPLRRYRLCAQCVRGGMLMLAMHGGECKQWPGYGRGHQHVFCFACTREWNRGCSHQATDCCDPGVQQVRVRDGELELGYVDGEAYLRWLNNKARDPPPTRYASGEEHGASRQARLKLTDRKQLLEESKKGTT